MVFFFFFFFQAEDGIREGHVTGVQTCALPISGVAGLVAAVSDDPSIEDDAERKAALRAQVARAGDGAAAVFAADKVSKARELRMRMDYGRFQRSDAAKLRHYEASLEMLDELMPGHELVDDLRAELDVVHALP